ncbi:MAG: polysaccharide deacetylase family protein [Betaproteobacteria bacterium]|nr:polysaccharide deacetylase family protein [Betaproteobacteria bacterium]
MSEAWRAFDVEIARWRDAGRDVEFWWRDDDATRPAPELERLLELCATSGVPLALAAVPEDAVPELFACLGGGVTVLQHGVDHINRATEGEKKTEFSESEPVDSAVARLSSGRVRLEMLAGTRAIPVLAPPWNRLHAALVRRLGAAGLRGLSTYGARTALTAAPGIVRFNAHVDIIAWRSGRGFLGDEQALGLAVQHLAARRGGAIDADEPTGWLTHHASHDAAAWAFLARLFDVTRRTAGVRWRRADELFGIVSRAR